MSKSINAYALIITVLLFGSLYWVMNVKTVNSSLQDGLDSEKLRSEALLSEKLLVEKDIAKLKTQLFTANSKSSNLDNELKQTLQKLNSIEADYKKSRNESQSLKSYKKQFEDLSLVYQEFQKKLDALSMSKSTADAENQKLSAQIAFLEERNKILNDDLRRASLASMDNTEIKALKGKKERLTVKASKTQKLIAEFEVPGSVRNVSYKIIDPTGKVLSNNDGTIASTIVANANNYTAATKTNETDLGKSKIEMVYTPKSKLKAGTYKIEILSESLHLGSLQVRLR